MRDRKCLSADLVAANDVLHYLLLYPYKPLPVMHLVQHVVT